MKVSPKKLLPLIVFAIAFTSVFSVRPAQAGYIVILQEVGPNVVATGSGAINLNGLSGPGPATNSPYMVSGQALLITGPTGVVANDLYAGFTGPTSFGSGGQIFADLGSGDMVGVAGFYSVLVVPQGYLSGTALSSTATWSNATFASLGLTPGTYEWTWGTGDDQNFTIEIVSPPNATADCQNSGWQTRTHGDGSPFRNQGQCIQYVNTGK